MIWVKRQQLKCCPQLSRGKLVLSARTHTQPSLPERVCATWHLDPGPLVVDVTISPRLSFSLFKRYFIHNQQQCSSSLIIEPGKVCAGVAYELCTLREWGIEALRHNYVNFRVFLHFSPPYLEF